MRKTIIALLLILPLALTACGQVDTLSPTKITTATVHGVECFSCGGVQYPAVFGEPRLSAEELKDLLAETDVDIVANAITNLPDCLRYIYARGFQEGDGGNSPAGVIETGLCFPKPLCDTMLYLLAGDVEESGRIDLYAAEAGMSVVCIKANGTYYSFDPFQLLRNAEWLSCAEDDAVLSSTDIPGEVDNLVKYYDFSYYDRGEYVASMYTKMSPEALAAKQAITLREYTDEELQALADQHPTLEQASEKLHTAADASRFLQLSGFYFRDPDVHWLFNDGTYVWNWVRTADLTYDLMYGTCGGIADLMNRLLAGDYDEQGYVRYIGAHIFNYFKVGGYYCFCDFTDYVGFGSEREYSGNQYFLGAYTVPQDFAEPYMLSTFPDAWDNPNDENYIRVFYIQRADGQDAQPIASEGGFEIIPSCAEEDTIILYLRDGYGVKYADIDSEACRPPEVLLSE